MSTEVNLSHGKKFLALGLSFLASTYALYIVGAPILLLVAYAVMELLRGTIGEYLVLVVLLAPVILIVKKFFTIMKTDIVDLVVESLHVQGEVGVIDLDTRYDDEITEKIRVAYLNAKKNLEFDEDVMLIRATDNVVNAFALSNMKDQSAIVVFDGLSYQLSLEELQAVIGHEIGHIIHNDSAQKVLMYASQYYVPFAEYYSTNLIIKIHNFAANIGNPFITLCTSLFLLLFRLQVLVVKFGLWITNFVNAFAYKQAEHLADYKGALSSSSIAMISALESITGDNDEEHESVLLKMLAEHPDTDVRIEYLKNLNEGN